MEIIIDKTIIGDNYPPYIIAEISANHNGSIENALSLIEKSHKSGANAVKIQTYRPDTITLNSQRPDFKITTGPWAGKTLYELYEGAHTPWQWHQTLFEFAKEIGVTIFSSPFDKKAVDLLENLGAPAYKIASFEAIDLPLIRYVSQTNKPVIISTGMANKLEIAEAIITARDAGCTQLGILHCVSGYPAPVKDYNLKTITDLKKNHNVVVGLSDHTLSNTTAIASIALGSSIIEKHVTLNRDGGGPDDSFSLLPFEFKNLCDASTEAWNALGTINYEKKSSELQNSQFRRSLYFVKDIKMGEKLSQYNVQSIRPGYGLAPKCIDDVLDKFASKDIKAGTAVSWDLIRK